MQHGISMTEIYLDHFPSTILGGASLEYLMFRGPKDMGKFILRDCVV